MLLYVHSCISKLVLFKDSYTFFAMSGTAVQINNSASGTVYITDDAAVEALMLDWLHRQEDAAADAIPVPLERRAQSSRRAMTRARARARAK